MLAYPPQAKLADSGLNSSHLQQLQGFIETVHKRMNTLKLDTITAGCLPPELKGSCWDWLVCVDLAYTVTADDGKSSFSLPFSPFPMFDRLRRDNSVGLFVGFAVLGLYLLIVFACLQRILLGPRTSSRCSGQFSSRWSQIG